MPTETEDEDVKRARYLRSRGYDRGESLPWVESVRYGVDPDDRDEEGGA